MPADDSLLLDQIYAAGLVPELWPSVITGLSDRLGGRGGSIFILSDGQLSWDAPEATRAIMEEYVAGGWDKNNVRLERLLARSHPGFIEDRSLLDEDDVSQIPIFRDFLLPRDIAFTAATVIKGAQDDIAVFSVDRGLAAGHFSATEFLWLDGLRPHLARSVALSSRLKMQQAATATATLQLLGIPAAVLSPTSRVVCGNALFDRLSGSVFLSAAFGRLVLTDRRADRLLRLVLDARNVARPAVRSIPVVRSGEGPVGILHVIPACRQSNDILGAGGTLIMLAQPNATAIPDAALLQWLYDLTPTEAHIGRALAAGQSVEEIALAAGNSSATVRTHVKHLLRKTGFTRQVDFVRCVASLAVVQARIADPSTADGLSTPISS